ncbi:hypothetical protein [Rothia aeria]|uniref:hypothetical protein n=1 Tax=Rothia aeria TaxID=172042 RepID=UPI003C77289A
MVEYDGEVYFISLKDIESINYSIEQCKYQPAVNNVIRDKIVDKYTSFFDIKIHNGDSVNLDSIFVDKCANFKVSIIDFFEVFLFNNLRNLNTKFVDYLKNNSEYEILKYYNDLVEYYNIIIDSIEDISHFLQSTYIPKPLAISVMVHTIDDRYLVTKRPMSLALGAGLSSVSVTGAMEIEDFKSSNPFAKCAIRELYEELNVKINPENINVLGIGLGRVKMQPVVIMNAHTELTSKEVINKSLYAEDYGLEVSDLQALDIKDLKIFLKENNFTEIGKFHIGNIV